MTRADNNKRKTNRFVWIVKNNYNICDMGAILLIGFLIYASYSYIQIVIYGRGVLFPNFERIDRKLHETIGYPSLGRKLWNTWWGKICYYLLLLFHLTLLLVVIYAIYGLAT